MSRPEQNPSSKIYYEEDLGLSSSENFVGPDSLGLSTGLESCRSEGDLFGIKLKLKKHNGVVFPIPGGVERHGDTGKGTRPYFIG